jgi:hypothetical protein
MKRQVKEYSYEISYYDLDNTLDEVIESLLTYKKEGWVGFDVVQDRYSDNKYLKLYKFREETDEEYQERLKVEEEIKIDSEKQKEKRRLQYEQLKKEFENETAS